jgi:hypothetical protein
MKILAFGSPSRAYSPSASMGSVPNLSEILANVETVWNDELPMSVQGQFRRFKAIIVESGLHPPPDIPLHRTK